MEISVHEKKRTQPVNEFHLQIEPLGKKLQRFAGRILRDEEAARDVVQDVFCQLWQKIQRLEIIENIEAFAITMTRNRCLDYLRMNRVAPAESKITNSDQGESSDLQHRMELSEAANLVKSLIAGLPHTQREVIYLRDIEQYNFDEISEITSLKYNAIRVNLTRARKKVRDGFRKYSEHGLHQMAQ
ncbi:RNA polymerase sigma factor [Gaoshiqia sp. Z1-71]|uniref:RNA polymerase sigma factor n=1 Tax=Gaoshiqia hydrogeniformans TaxID=3290090 RepID=UPI003BF83113